MHSLAKPTVTGLTNTKRAAVSLIWNLLYTCCRRLDRHSSSFFLFFPFFFFFSSFFGGRCVVALPLNPSKKKDNHSSCFRPSDRIPKDILPLIPGFALSGLGVGGGNGNGAMFPPPGGPFIFVILTMKSAAAPASRLYVKCGSKSCSPPLHMSSPVWQKIMLSSDGRPGTGAGLSDIVGNIVSVLGSLKGWRIHKTQMTREEYWNKVSR